MKRKSGNYNKTKKRSLEVLENLIWMDVPTFARKAKILPARRAYTYLAHLETLGLVIRRGDLGSKLHFQITPRGIERLTWLRAQDKTPTLEELVYQFFGATIQ